MKDPNTPKIHDDHCEYGNMRPRSGAFCGCEDRADLREAERAQDIFAGINAFLRLRKDEYRP